jgi:hypothetical protein
MSCVICVPVEGRIPRRVVHEDEEIIASLLNEGERSVMP